MELQECEEAINNIIEDIINSKVTIQNMNNIPESEEIPLEIPHCLKIEDVTCVFVDMVNSTKMSLVSEESVKIYDIFIKSLVKILVIYGAEYVDIKGDGAFGLFSNKDSAIPALCAAVTFRTICEKVIQNKFDVFPVKMHAGIDTDTVLVKRIGLRGDRNNEVWIGKTVNIAAKLASLAPENTIYVSDRAYKILSQSVYEKYLKYSCGCPSGTSSQLWAEYINNHPFLMLEKYYALQSCWCDKHGKEYCSKIMSIYKKKNT